MKAILVFIKYFIWRAFSRKRGQGQYAEINDILMYYEIHGEPDGAPLLFLHGGSAFIDAFAGQIPYFAGLKKYRLICAGGRAHDRGSDSEQPLSYALMAQDCVALLDHLGVERTDLIGWNDGGIIGLDLALNHPHRLRKMVLIGANFDADGVLQAQDELESAEPDYTLDQLARIETPTLVMHGEKEEFIKLEHSQELAQAIPNAQLVVIPQATHEGLMEEPQKYNGIMAEFLGGINTQSG
jgi:pimeloyl-ACP methyl ester carboxylesterase